MSRLNGTEGVVNRGGLSNIYFGDIGNIHFKNLSIGIKFLQGIFHISYMGNFSISLFYGYQFEKTGIPLPKFLGIFIYSLYRKKINKFAL